MKRTPNPETCICYRKDKDPRFCKAHDDEGSYSGSDPDAKAAQDEIAVARQLAEEEHERAARTT